MNPDGSCDEPETEMLEDEDEINIELDGEPPGLPEDDRVGDT